MRFRFSVFDEMTIRQNPTTQIAIDLVEWPGNTFLLWFPESTGELWNNMMAEVAHQDFAQTAEGELIWRFDGNRATIEAELEKCDDYLILEVRIRNRSSTTLEHVKAQNCFHLSRADDFACRDFSRILIRTDGQWRRLSELRPTCNLPMYYRPNFIESGREDSWRGHYRHFNQEPRADHPLIICLDKRNTRAVATASDDCQCVFHNSRNDYLLCLHSQQAPIPFLEPGAQATFRQKLFFVEGAVEECIAAYERAPSKDLP